MEHEVSDIRWHTLSAEDAAKQLAVDVRMGLSAAEATARLAQHGPNRLTARRGPGPFRRLLAQLSQPLVAILIAAGVITALIGELVDASVIAGVVIVNTLVGFFQENQALTALAALARTMAATGRVLRDGYWTRLDATQLVPGDIVSLHRGDKVPADMRLLSCRALRLDESALTGESAPVDKDLPPVDAKAPLAERPCLVFSATVVVHGQGCGIVTDTGDAAVIGRIAALTASTDALETPLTRHIARFSQAVLIAILVLSVVTFAVGLWRGESASAMFMAAVALAVGAIPEGLPAAVTVILAIGVSRMARRRAVIRHLPAVETLGSATVICTDKTGTLTENRMTVTEVIVDGVVWQRRDGQFVASDPGTDTPAARGALLACLRAGMLCNDADTPLETSPGNTDKPPAESPASGDPTEKALLVAARMAGLSRSEEERRLPRLDEEPFASEHRFMATLHDAGPAMPRRLYLKGSTEAVLARLLDTEDRESARIVRETAEAMGRRGLRVLALAERDVPADAHLVVPEMTRTGLRVLGLVGLLDPPRPEAAPAVAACRRAGIQVKMITGDQASTAAAIARQIGLEDDAQRPVLTGRELEDVADMDLARVAEATTVFARVSPAQKLRLVRALAARGHVVAMTGDGVNDAPALRQAAIGVAMGQRGSEAAREAADMVLTDDNFATLAAAVEEGRAVYDNLVKFIVWTLPTNVGEGLVIVTAILFGLPLPISPVQILWINMTTAGSLGLMLAFEPREPGIMDRQPRNPDHPLLDTVLIRRIVVVGGLLLAGAFGLFYAALGRGASSEQAQTVAVNAFVALEALYLLNCRSLTRSAFSLPFGGNPLIAAGMIATVCLQLLFTYAPFMHDLFGTAPIEAVSWLRIAAVGLGGFLVIELEKRLLGKRASCRGC